MSNGTLGILGLGSRTTQFYMQELNRMFQAKKGGYSTYPFILLNTDFHKINTLLPEPSLELDEIVQQYIQSLEQLGVDILLIPNITLHQTIDRLKVSKPLLHPLRICATKLLEQDIKNVTLFGTAYTMSADYIPTYLEQYGIEVEVPEASDKSLIDQFRKQVYADCAKETEIHQFYAVLEKYASKAPVVLACTELSIFPSANTAVFDLVKLQLDESINWHFNS